ncbi:MAG: amidase family protein [Firmicutes bacterium]|nr:amidase family protein [Bacillota bacterium]MDY5997677.1 amidase family protein [Erysipelotrichaceae bacterium]
MFKDYVNKDVNESVELALKRAHKSHELYNDVVTFIDPSAQIANMPKEGKMKGIPIALKDNVCTKGIKTTACSNILANYVPIYNAHIVDKLQQAGAICIAKASMDELAMGGTNLTSNIGPCLNPYDTTRMSGGSSGGSAVLVASGAVDFAIGSDTGDSIRKPASYCGIVGVKPTYGRISRYGIIPYSSSLDHVGYFTRSIEDAAVSLEVLAGRDDRDMTSSYREVEEYSKLLNSDLNGKKIAVFKNVYDGLTNQKTIDIFNDLLKKMEAKGAIIDFVALPDDLCKALLPTYYLIANCEATANHSNLDGLRFGVQKEGKDVEEIMINSRTAGFGSLIRKRFVIGSYGLFVENQEKLFRQAQRVRRLIVNEVKDILSKYDCLIAPASNDIAPHLDDNSRDQLSDEYLIVENHMVIGNFTGYPSMTLPMGMIDGCPIGVNLTCMAFEESKMFNLGLAIEEITGLKDMKVSVE